VNRGESQRADAREPATAQDPRQNLVYKGLQYRFLPRYRVIWVATALLILICLVIEQQTFDAPALKIETPLIAVLAIASLGQLLVVMVGGFDLSVAAVMTFASAMMLVTSQGSNDKLVFAIVITLVCCVAAGLISGVLTSLGLNALIVTLAMGGVLAAITLLITNGGVDVLAYNVPTKLSNFAIKYVGRFSNLLFVAIALVIVQALVLRNTKVGRRLLAAGSNPAAARVVGIPVRRYNIGAYGAAGLLYGLAGIFLAAFVEHPDLNVGEPYLLSTFIVVALGGAILGGGPASVIGTFVGAIFLVLLNQFLAIKGLNPGDQSLIQGIVLIAAVAAVTTLRSGALRIRLHGPRRHEEVTTTAAPTSS
jgi:ribose transport system permease protein